jgi:hypothetical protein
MSAAMSAAPANRIDLGRLDRCRRPQPLRLGAGRGVLGAKEWHHVVMHHPEVSVLVNYSETVDCIGRSVLRAMVMVHTHEWTHELLTSDEGASSIAVLTLDWRLDDRASFRWTGDRYRATFRGSRIEFDLELVPNCDAQFVSAAPLSANERISWVIVPRLAASGSVRVAGRDITVTDVPSYHDHNWGHFAWGGDFAWEWIAATGDDWSLTASRLLDGNRGTTTAQYLLFEVDGRTTVFRDAEVTVRTAGLLGPVPAAVVPGVMRMVAPTSVDDVPRTFTLVARREDQTVHATIAPDVVARVVMPSDVRCDAVTVLAETLGAASVQASTGGRVVDDHRRGVLELLR